jgi:hypothetical protein
LGLASPPAHSGESTVRAGVSTLMPGESTVHTTRVDPSDPPCWPPVGGRRFVVGLSTVHTGRVDCSDPLCWPLVGVSTAGPGISTVRPGVSTDYLAGLLVRHRRVDCSCRRVDCWPGRVDRPAGCVDCSVGACRWCTGELTVCAGVSTARAWLARRASRLSARSVSRRVDRSRTWCAGRLDATMRETQSEGVRGSRCESGAVPPLSPGSGLSCVPPGRTTLGRRENHSDPGARTLGPRSGAACRTHTTLTRAWTPEEGNVGMTLVTLAFVVSAQ